MDHSRLSPELFESKYLGGNELIPEFLKAGWNVPRFADLKAKMLAAVEPFLIIVEQAPVCLVHGDAFSGNMIETESGLRLLDFEGCHLGNLAYDLATFLQQHVKDEQKAIFLDEYGYGDTDTERVLLWYYRIKRFALGLWFVVYQMDMEVFVPTIVEGIENLMANPPALPM